MREITCFNSLRNLPKIALLSVYAAAACEPNLKEFLHSFEKLHTIGAVVFGGCHPLEAQNFIHNYDICENKQNFLLEFVFRSKCMINEQSHRTLLYY